MAPWSSSRSALWPALEMRRSASDTRESIPDPPGHLYVSAVSPTTIQIGYNRASECSSRCKYMKKAHDLKILGGSAICLVKGYETVSVLWDAGY